MNELHTVLLLNEYNIHQAFFFQLNSKDLLFFTQNTTLDQIQNMCKWNISFVSQKKKKRKKYKTIKNNKKKKKIMGGSTDFFLFCSNLNKVKAGRFL